MVLEVLPQSFELKSCVVLWVSEVQVKPVVRGCLENLLSEVGRLPPRRGSPCNRLVGESERRRAIET